MKCDYIISDGDKEFRVDVETREFAEGIIEALVVERKRLGLTQKQIADMTGMKTSNVTRVESCKYIPTIEVLMRYAKAVGKQLQFELLDMEKVS